MELKLARVIKGNKKDLFVYVNSNRNTREDVSPLLNEGDVLVTGDSEKMEMLIIFASVFTAKIVPQKSQTLV